MTGSSYRFPGASEDLSGYCGAGLFRDNGEFHSEDGTLARMARDVNPASMVSDYSIADAKAEASPLTNPAGTEEWIENMGQVGPGDARAIIGERHVKWSHPPVRS